MKTVKNMSKKLIAILLSAAMTFTPMIQSMPVYAAEVETQNEIENLGTMPVTDNAVLDDVSGDEDVEEAAAGEEQAPEDAEIIDDDMKSDAFESGDDSNNENGADTEKVEEKTEEKTETKTEAKEDTEQEETVSAPVYEEVMEEESESGSEEESESESEEMSQEDVGVASVSGVTVADIKAGGWNESIYAEIAKVKGKDNMSAITKVSWTGADEGELSENDLKYLVRPGEDGGVRIDIPGLKAGTYDLSITVNGSGELKKTGIEVYAYDRSGYAHFNYKDGVGAYKDDGTLKDNAIVIYVTDENKNTVTITDDKTGTTVTGIGNILNSVGKECGEAGHDGECRRVSGKKVYYGKANSNQNIITKLSEANTPLVVRFVGVVSDSGLYSAGTFNASSEGLIDGLTVYDSYDNGGSPGDNGHMARIQSGTNITLEGIGADAAIDGWGFHFMAESSTSSKGFGKGFEVRNLTFINTPEDAIGMEGQQSGDAITAGVERCWVHNNEFYCPHITSPAESDKSEGDGSVDFKRGQYFTCSYNYFDSCHKTNLVGSSDSSLQFNLTYHHNYWYMCKARGPLTRQANVHMYNNIFDMQTDYAMNTRANAYIFSEYNMFYACKSPQAVEAGAIKSYNDSISSVLWNKGSAGTVVENKSEIVPNSCQYQNTKYDKFDTDGSQSYIPSNQYQLETEFEDLRKTIVSQTGVMDKNPRRPEKISKSEYSVINRMIDASKVNKFDSLPQDLAPGKISKTVYAFEVGAAFDLEVEYASGSKAVVGVLVNEEGENLLTGNGSVADLPAGRYMIQAETFQPGDPTKGTIAVFKDMTINSLKISQHDPNAHFHKWKLDSSKSVLATCTAEGKNVYICEGTGDCTAGGTKEELVPALGHSYGAWKVVTEATEDADGLKRRDCVRCDVFEEVAIPKGTSGTGTGGSDVPGGGSTAAGDYELYFTGKKTNGDTDFFTVSGSYAEKKGPVTVNGVAYTDCLKIESKTNVSFSCNDGATLFMAFDGASKKVKIDGTAYTTDSKGTLTVENLSSGLHNITKNDSMNLFYIAVSNGASEETYYTLSFEYNYDDSPDAKTVEVIAGKSYASMLVMVPETFTRTGHKLSGLYTDANCTKAVEYPYVVNGNATLYADWEESDEEITYSLIFDSNGGSAVATVRIASSQIYTITQQPTRTGYAFAGWYDALEGGKLVDIIDGSKLTKNMTVYARWNQIESVKLSLDCSMLAVGDIEGKTDLNESGFIVYALPEGGGADKQSPKYFMTVKDGGLYTNGVRLTDTNIPGNEDGLLKTIEFTTEGSGVLSVEMALSGKAETGKTYKLVLAKKSADGSLAKVSESAITTATTKTTKEFEIPDAGTYYLYAEGDKGVVYYNMKFTEQMYTIIWQVGNGTVSGDINLDSVTARKGEQITLPSDCTPASGYIFKGWSADDGTTLLKKPAVYEVKEEDATSGTIVITAIYEAQTYKLKYDANGGTLPSGMQNEITVKTGEHITLGNCIPVEGYQFVGWSLGHSTEIVNSPYIVNFADADADMTITLKAVFVSEGEKVVYYTVTLDTEGGTLLDGGGRERKVLANRTIDPGKCEKVGYVFKGWTIDGKDIKIPYTVKGDVTLKAKYSFSGGAPTEGIYILGLEESYVYTGAKIIPDIEVWDYDIPEGRILAPDVDYKVAYKNNVKITEDEEDETKWAEVIVTGKGNYAGKSTSQRFRITEEAKVTENFVELKGAKIGKIDNVEYTGEALYPNFELTLRGEAPVWYEYDKSEKQYVVADEGANKGTAIAANVAVSNNVNKGTATILVTGARDDNTGKVASVKKTFKITAVDLSKANVTVEQIAPVEYAVKGAVPASIKVTVTRDDKTFVLKQGKDYTVKYGKNKVVGQATVTITGKGNYTKKYPELVEYTISPLDMSDLEVSAVTACVGVKPSKIKATVVDKNGTALKASQYKINVYETEDAEDVLSDEPLGEGATIYVEAQVKDEKNLTGTTERQEFTVGKDFSKAKVVLNRDDNSGKVITKSYTGSPVMLDDDDIIVTYPGEEEPLTVGIDYEIVEYINNTNKGTATAVIRGNYDYSGTKTVKFKILGKSMAIEERKPWDQVSWMIQNFKSRFAK